MSLQLINQNEFESIRTAVAEAEKVSSGEIVPYAVPSSNQYTLATWRASLLGTFIGLGGYCLSAELREVWGIDPLITFLTACVGAWAGWFAVQLFPSLRRLLIGPERMNRHVMNRAKRAFLEEEVFATEHRGGILIFLSIFERRVVVLADSAINKHVPQTEWEEIVQMITASIRAGNPAEGLTKAIHRCGELLVQHQLKHTSSDRDQLRNDLRMGKPDE